SLPDAVGPVLYAVNDSISGVNETVELQAVKSPDPGRVGMARYPYQKGASEDSQPAFATTTSALGAPTLLPADQSTAASAKQITFFFDRPVKQLIANVLKDAIPPTDTGVTAKLSDDGKAVSVDSTTLKPGKFLLKITVTYSADT